MGSKKLRVLFVCTGNSCRSQIAETFAREMGVDAYSAGTEPKRVHPLAIRVMNDLGFGIVHEMGRGLDEFIGQSFDFVITLCDRARETCPTWRDAKAQLYWPIEDPAATQGPVDRQLRAFRMARSEICARLTGFLAAPEASRALSTERC